MATKSSSNHKLDEPVEIVLVHDSMTFDKRQEIRLREIQRRVNEEMNRKKRDWEREVQRMRDEFFELHRTDRKWGSDESISSDPFIIRRRGSTEILDMRKMKSLFQDLPDAGRKFKIRFNIADFDPENVKVCSDCDRIVVTATKTEEDDSGEIIEREYSRKIEKPAEVDVERLKSFLTCDGILIVEAFLPPHSLNLRRLSHSHSSHSSPGSRTSSRSRSRSPSCSPNSHPKFGIPTYIDDDVTNLRRLSLVIDIGVYFKARDITVNIVKDNRLMVKAKFEERTSEKFSKNKYFKEFDLPEKIEVATLRAGLMIKVGKLYIGALTKGCRHERSLDEAVNWLCDEIGIDNKLIIHCNVLDLACFPPAAVMTSSFTS